MQTSNSCSTSDSNCRACCPSASPESQVVQRHSAPTPRHGAPRRLGYTSTSHLYLSTFSFSFQGVEATAVLPRLQSSTQRERHRGQKVTSCSVLWMDFTRATTLADVQLLGGLADIAVVNVSPGKLSTCCSCAPPPSPPPLRAIVISTRQAKRGEVSVALT
jgi:hypothetical protein